MPVFNRRVGADRPNRIDRDFDFRVGMFGKELGVLALDGLAAGKSLSRAVEILAVDGPQRRDRGGIATIERRGEGIGRSADRRFDGLRRIVTCSAVA